MFQVNYAHALNAFIMWAPSQIADFLIKDTESIQFATDKDVKYKVTATKSDTLDHQEQSGSVGNNKCYLSTGLSICPSKETVSSHVNSALTKMGLTMIYCKKTVDTNGNLGNSFSAGFTRTTDFCPSKIATNATVVIQDRKLIIKFNKSFLAEAKLHSMCLLFLPDKPTHEAATPFTMCTCEGDRPYAPAAERNATRNRFIERGRKRAAEDANRSFFD